MSHGFEVGDLIRCWHLQGMGFDFSVGIIIVCEENYAKICLQESGETVWISYRAMLLLKRNNPLK